MKFNSDFKTVIICMTEGSISVLFLVKNNVTFFGRIIII